jgi:hypothetical protein
MPLDTGEIAEESGARLLLDSRLDVGAVLRLARRSLGLTEEDIARSTKVPAGHIAAIEALDFEALPALPFVIGYVRAYAQALGLDAEAVVTRFRAQAPKIDDRLRPPGGVRYDGMAGVRWLIVAGVLVAGAVGVWNVTRRAQLQGKPPAAAPARPASASASDGPARIGAPLPTPPEASTPPVYQTPGLESARAVPPEGAPGKIDAGALTDAAGAPGPAFVAAGPVYGAPAPPPGEGQDIVLQARRATPLVVRGPTGAVYFARLLGPGEAWRAPPLAGLVANVGAPGSVEVFVGGLSRGRLLRGETPLARLGEVGAPGDSPKSDGGGLGSRPVRSYP